jgi:hypothetical protein
LVVDGNSAGTAVTDAQGNATFTMAGLNAGTHTLSVSFAGDLDLTATKAAATLTIAKAGVSLKWSQPNTITYGTPLGSDQLNATATVPGSFTYTPPLGTLLNTGTQTLLATFTPEDQQNYTNGEISVSLIVNKADQPALLVVAPTNLVYGTTAILSTTGGAGTGIVTFSTGASTGCAGAFSYINVTNASGTCAVFATKAGDSNYNGVTSSPVVITLQEAAQTIAFASLPNVRVADSPIIVSATASSGLAVTFTSSTPVVCTAGGVNGSTITLLVSGTCTVVAHQGGDNNYLAAPDVTQSFTAGSGKLDQTISFASLRTRTILETPFTVSATASSGLAVTFTSLSTSVCTVGGTNGTTVTLKSTGTCGIVASQLGSANYNPAPSVTQSFSVTKVPQTIAWVSTPGMLILNQPFAVSATASSGLAVTFTTTTPAICSFKKNTVTGFATGNCTIVASQSGNGTYYAAQSLSLTVQVSK